MRAGKVISTGYQLIAGGYLAYRLTVLAANARALKRLAPTSGETIQGDGAPTVSILVPARNEAETLPQTLPGLLAQGGAEVLVLDDDSSDETASLARGCGARVIAGQPLPAGWSGKSWACHQLAEHASGEILIFTDADVRWNPGALAAVVAHQRTQRADLLTVWPRQVNRGGQRLLTPMVDAAMLGHFPVAALNLPIPGAVAANGQVMALTAAAYELSGGHAGIKGDLLDDMALARAVKESGGRVRIVLGGDAVSVTMYASYAASIEGLAKSTLGLHSGSRLMLAASALWFHAIYTLPWLLPVSPGIAAIRAATLADRAVVNVLTGRRSPRDLAEGLLGPLTPLLALPVYWRAVRRQVTWRGRSYEQ